MTRNGHIIPSMHLKHKQFECIEQFYPEVRLVSLKKCIPGELILLVNLTHNSHTLTKLITLISNSQALRIKYKDKTEKFREDQIEKKNPIDLFGKWFDEAFKTEEIFEPNAMCLATATK